MNADEIREQFNSIEKLYHYTAFNSAIKILQSRTLLFGRLKDMNDINELYRPLFPEYNPDLPDEKFENLHSDLEKEIGKYQQISLTMDGRRLGFDIPAMWGHYAEKGNGVCFIFDKNKFVNQIKNDRNRRVLYGQIKYTNSYTSSIICQTNADGSMRPFNRKEEKDCFFHKTKDWQYEQEFRVLVKSDSGSREKLDFQDSLFAIVMHNAESVSHEQTIFNSLEYKVIEKITKDKNDYSTIPVMEHCVFIDETLLNTKEHKIWTSKPINEENFVHDG